MHILIADDDLADNKIINDGLRYANFTPDSASTAEDAIFKIRTNDYDLAIIDWVFPNEDTDGSVLVRELRKRQPKVPVIMLTSRTAAAHLKEGLGHGANIYLKKPFLLPELIAYVESAMRDFRGSGENQSELINGPLKINIFSHQVTLRGKQLFLNNKEFQILRHLVMNTGGIIKRTELIEKVWGDLEIGMTSNTIDVTMNSLRKKLEKYGQEYLTTIRGVGHRLEKY